MSRGPLFLALALAALLLAPTASAEFGPESEDGYPISVDGLALRPPVEGQLILHPTGVVPAAAPLNKVGPLTIYPYYPLLTAEVQRLANDHPGLVKLTSAGKSGLGLDMWLLEIADFENPDMIPLDQREVLYIDGGTHSNEYSGVYFVTEIAQFLLDEYETNETAKWIVQNRHVFILPMVNPDGSNAFGRLNAQTVNINRNFPATWGTVEEQPILNNPGPEPGSEPETQIVMALMDKLQPDYVNSIHCCGNLWLHPWGAEEIPAAPDLQMFTRICDEAFYDVREDCGPIWSTIYPASGTTADEGYGRLGASSWTYEMSGRANKVGVWGEPVSELDVREQERESWRGIMHAFLNVEKYGAYPKILAIEGDANRLSVLVENIGYGNFTIGNLTLGGKTVPIPPLGPNEQTTLTVEGPFTAGNLTVQVDWVKRHWLSPSEVRTLNLPLVEEAGRLKAILPDVPVTPLANPGESVDENTIPTPALGLLAAALVGVALLARRRA
ncbi:MAG TPA: M14 family zinc carboxypeptidase [Candidatus Thermoplasmatota archaeon]|nr:M14 family zinc carboxypeptidase [Candidatus Thermoplasmatota archaeon]